MEGREGEYILLDWYPYDPTAEYIRGHVTKEQAKKALVQEGIIFEYEEIKIRHIYARWSLEGHGYHDMTFRPYEESGRGRFKVTEVSI